MRRMRAPASRCRSRLPRQGAVKLSDPGRCHPRDDGSHPSERGSRRGKITNRYKKPLSQAATIYSVYYDSSGHIIGGDYTGAGAAIQPKATVSFSFPFVDLNVASAKISVDPCGDLAVVFGQCKLP